MQQLSRTGCTCVRFWSVRPGYGVQESWRVFLGVVCEQHRQFLTPTPHRLPSLPILVLCFHRVDRTCAQPLNMLAQGTPCFQGGVRCPVRLQCFAFTTTAQLSTNCRLEYHGWPFLFVRHVLLEVVGISLSKTVLLCSSLFARFGYY
jgi:hypothetical protein